MVPPRYYHQRDEEFSNGDFRISISTIADRFRVVSDDTLKLLKEPSSIDIRRSKIENFADSLKSTYRGWEQHFKELRFIEIIHLPG